MQRLLVGAADVHAGAPAHRLEPLQHLDIARGIAGLGRTRPARAVAARRQRGAARRPAGRTGLAPWGDSAFFAVFAMRQWNPMNVKRISPIDYAMVGAASWLAPGQLLRSERQMRPSGPSRRMCWEVHPPLTVGRGRVIYGGNCALPAVKDADLYIGLDVSFRKTSDQHMAFIIPDGGAPADVAAFKGLVAWVSDQLDLGRKVHVGCIAGHGRTGILHGSAGRPPRRYRRSDPVHPATLLPGRGRDAHAGRFPGRALRLQAGRVLTVSRHPACW